MGDRFSLRYEANSIDDGIARQQAITGTQVQWWFYRPDLSTINPTYPEGDSASGRRWHGPFTVPVYAMTRTQGGIQNAAEGFQTIDTVRVTMSYAQARKADLVPLTDRARGNVHLKDRFVWDGKVWEISSMVSRNLTGRLRRIMILIQAQEVLVDEMVNDVDFIPALNTAKDDYDIDWMESQP